MTAQEEQLRKIMDEIIGIALSERKKSGTRELDAFKGVVKNLADNALRTSDAMRKKCQEHLSLREDCYLLHHYLDYIKKLCEGKV